MEVKLLYTEIASNLETQILNDEIKEGDKLPSERELSIKYGVSRNVIREAIGVLRGKGLVKVHAGRGAYATKPNSLVLTSGLESVMKYYNTSIEEILDVREDLEKAIIRKVIQAASKKDIEEMYKIYHQMEDNKLNLGEFTKLDIELHKLFAKSTNNSIYHLLLSSFIDMTQKVVFQTTIMFPNSTDTAQEQHLALIQAIENRDEIKAKDVIISHMETIRSEIKALRKNGVI